MAMIFPVVMHCAADKSTFIYLAMGALSQFRNDVELICNKIFILDAHGSEVLIMNP